MILMMLIMMILIIQRVFGIMRDKNPEMVGGERKKFVMRPPQVIMMVMMMVTMIMMMTQVVRVGSKKTAFANFNEIAKMLHR